MVHAFMPDMQHHLKHISYMIGESIFNPYQWAIVITSSSGNKYAINEHEDVGVYGLYIIPSMMMPCYGYRAGLMHYSDVIMSTMASQITGVSIVNTTVCSVGDQRKHQSSASLASLRGIHRWPGNSPHKGPVTQRMFSFDDVIIGSPYWVILSGTNYAPNEHEGKYGPDNLQSRIMSATTRSSVDRCLNAKET